MADDSREAIIEAATKLFSKKGFEGTSISQIAKEAGTAKSLIYHYFQSKKEILDEILRRGTDDILRIHKEMVAVDEMTEEHVMKITNRLTSLMRKRQDVLRIMHHELLSNTYDINQVYHQFDYFFDYAKERALAYHKDNLHEQMKFVVGFIFFGAMLYHQYVMYEGYVSKALNYDRNEMWKVFMELYKEIYLASLPR